MKKFKFGAQFGQEVQITYLKKIQYFYLILKYLKIK